MKLKALILQGFILILFFLPSAILYNQTPPSGLKIWFNRPADSWNDALPVGNGRLGAMIFGGVEIERIQLNEESVWTGKPRWDANPDATTSFAQTPNKGLHVNGGTGAINSGVIVRRNLFYKNEDGFQGMDLAGYS